MDNFDTLKLNKEFRRAYGRGKSFVSGALVSYIVPNRQNSLRIGITVGKKVGCAVKRNRSKRVITAAFRECAKHLSPGYDIVFVARSKTPFVKSQVIFKAMKQHFVQFGIWNFTDEEATN
ncbi:MAG: ribonuclease P protein component [Clostridia bacterium]|nr:ribonuclease P protein component [Clostridia bacterium]